MNELSKMRLCLCVSAFATLVSVAAAVMMLLYTIRHDRELAERDLAHARKVSVVEGRLAAQEECKDKTAEQLAGIKNWMIAVYESGNTHSPLPK